MGEDRGGVRLLLRGLCPPWNFLDNTIQSSVIRMNQMILRGK